MNINKWQSRFITDMSLKYNSERTIAIYSNNVKRFLEFFSSHKEPKSIPNELIKRYLLSFSTLNTRKQNLCSIRLFYRVTVGMPKKVSKIPYPKQEKKLPRVIETKKLISTIKNISNLKHKALIALGYECALRRSEVINLKMECIDRNRMLILIKNSKGNKDRYVPFSHELLKILEDYYRAYKPKEYLFNGQNSVKYSETSYNNVVKKYLGHSTHTLRHSGITTMHENGVEISSLSKHAGHKSIKTTQIYTHISLRTLQNIKTPLSL